MHEEAPVAVVLAYWHQAVEHDSLANHEADTLLQFVSHATKEVFSGIYTGNYDSSHLCKAIRATGLVVNPGKYVVQESAEWGVYTDGWKGRPARP